MSQKRLTWIFVRVLLLFTLFALVRCDSSLEEARTETGANIDMRDRSARPTLSVAQSMPSGPTRGGEAAVGIRNTSTPTPPPTPTKTATPIPSPTPIPSNTPIPSPTLASLREFAIPPTPRPTQDVVESGFGFDWVPLEHQGVRILYPNGWWTRTDQDQLSMTSADYSLGLAWVDMEMDMGWLFTESNQRSTIVQQYLAEMESELLADLQGETTDVTMRRFDQSSLGGLPTAGASVYEYVEDGDWVDGDVVYGGTAVVLCGSQYICFVDFSKIDQPFTATDWDFLDYFLSKLEMQRDGIQAGEETLPTASAATEAPAIGDEIQPPKSEKLTGFQAPAEPATQTPETSLPGVTLERTPVRTPTAASSSAPDGPIDWAEASAYLGQTVTVCGNVASAMYANASEGKPTFIDLGEEYPSPNRLQIIIWDEHRRSFPAPPEKYYAGKVICVEGYLDLRDVPEVEVKSPLQIRIQEP